MKKALQIIEVPPEPHEQPRRSLYDRLDMSSRSPALARRANELTRSVRTSMARLDILRERVSNAVSESKSVQLNETLEKNTLDLCEREKSNTEIVHTLQIFQFILAGMMAFNLVDRMAIDWMSTRPRPERVSFGSSPVQRLGLWHPL